MRGAAKLFPAFLGDSAGHDDASVRIVVPGAIQNEKTAVQERFDQSALGFRPIPPFVPLEKQDIDFLQESGAVQTLNNRKFRPLAVKLQHEAATPGLGVPDNRAKNR